MSGAEAPMESVEATRSGGYRARCPSCEKDVWLNRFQDQPSTTYTFPEHIGIENRVEGDVGYYREVGGRSVPIRF